MSVSRPDVADQKGTRIALFTSLLDGGGIQNVMRNLAGALAEAGFAVDLLVCYANSASPQVLVPPGVRLVVLRRSPPVCGRLGALRADPRGVGALLLPVLLPLKAPTKLRYLASLIAYLRRQRPQALISAASSCNLVAVWARRRTGVDTRVVVTQHNVFSRFVQAGRGKWRWRFLPRLVRRGYAQADAVAAVSNAVADDLAATTGLPRAAVHTVVNPVVDDSVYRRAQQPLAHAWFAAGSPPVVLAVIRLVEQKDPATLLRAFATARQRRPLRLMVLGDGPDRGRLQKLAAELGVVDDVALPGWVDNPFPYMARAGVLVLPSLWEGLPTVLIQALACGCPIVATDCPGGSAEILNNGEFGRLVAIGDSAAMADAILATLNAPPNAAALKARAACYSTARAAAHYAALFGAARRAQVGGSSP